MFFDPQRLLDVRCMFLALQPAERFAAIQRLLPHQKSDFIGIFKAMDGLPVTVRLLDPPLHEFLPRTEAEMGELAHAMGTSAQHVRATVDALREQNPMLGHRGCRLGILYPDATKMQARALFEAALEVIGQGTLVLLEIMVPLVGITGELHHQKGLIDQTAREVFEAYGRSMPYQVGTMIELPRACLIAGQLAKEAQFFSFGTNDLTQTTFGISRDDSASFLPAYTAGVPDPLNPHRKMQLLPHDPFQVLDADGVGALMHLAVDQGRAQRPDLKCGICGEHGGESQSIALCQQLNLNYVSCSPYRLPLARLASAQAAHAR
jgi:pyruvate,orthophosphate dikinase